MLGLDPEASEGSLRSLGHEGSGGPTLEEAAQLPTSLWWVATK